MHRNQTTLTGLSEERAWHRYCGFLDLTLPGFMGVQRQRLLDALPALAASTLGRSLMDGGLPRSIDEFRLNVRLTDYEQYMPVFDSAHAAELPEPPVFWARTSRRNSDQTNIPYTQMAFDQLMDTCTAALMLASADGPGRVTLDPNDRVLYNLPPSPFLSGMLAEGLADRLKLHPVLDHKPADGMDFHDKVTLGFERALEGGVDAVASMTSVLLRMGQSFERSKRHGGLRKVLSRPKTALRFARALVVSKLTHRGVLPRDLWPVKALVCWGSDTAVHREELRRYWGVDPYEFMATSEGGIMALQSWSRQGMTFVPTTNFLEFIPEDELARERRSPNFDPATHLMDELEVGRRYEVVITSCNGMPFVRYRTGELVELTAAQDEEAGTVLPQFLPVGRADEIIDIEGFTRLDEKTFSRAVKGATNRPLEWTARKEFEEDEPVLRVYVERGDRELSELQVRLHESLLEEDSYYRDLQSMLDVQPLRITGVGQGSFRTFYEQRRERGYALDRRSMPRINATDDEIGELLGGRSMAGDGHLEAVA